MMTPEQNANIADFWKQNSGNPQAIRDAMTQYGVGTADLATALNYPVAPVAQWLSDTGAPAGFGGQTTQQAPHQSQTAAQPQNPNVSVGGAQPNLGMGGVQQNSQYTPNPYLGQMAQGITSHMYDNWTRNQLPSIRSGAMAAGGFGGSRQGVVEANGLNDMNRSLGQNLSNLYGSDYNNAMGRNLQQQSLNNSYDLGLRSSDLGFSNLDANINQNNFNNQLASANFGMGVYNTLNNQTQAGIQAGTNIQNTPLDYQKYFTNSANGVGSGYGTSNTSQTNQGNPWLGALGGAQIGNQIQKNWG